MQGSTGKELSQFAEDVLRGLSATPKSLSSKYFYDDEGSRLFREIMELPEYYLTNCEMEIFRDQYGEIFERSPPAAAFDLMELGAGDGTKTAVLVDHFLKQSADITYSPIDISQEALDFLGTKFTCRIPLAPDRSRLAIISRFEIAEERRRPAKSTSVSGFEYRQF